MPTSSQAATVPNPDKISCQYSDSASSCRFRPLLAINTPLIYHVRVARSSRTQVPTRGQTSLAVDSVAAVQSQDVFYEAFEDEALCELSRFRAGLHACFTRRGDALFELADAMLCAQGPVRSPVELSLEPEFRRRHGSVYDALAKGRISSDRLRHLLADLAASARTGEPLMFAIDTTPLARPDAQYAGELTMVQVRGKGGDRWLPGWPYSLLVGIGWGSTSWVDPIEARRLRPGEEHTDVTIGQITGLLKDLAATGKQQPGDPPPLVLLDAGNYATDLTHALADARSTARRRYWAGQTAEGYVELMASALYKRYLEWYHGHAAKKRWATFAPSEQRVEVGGYGWFGNDLLFNTAADQNIAKQFGIDVQVSNPEITEGPSLRFEARDFHVRVDGGASLPLPLKAPVLVKAGAKITLEAQKEHWFALQMRQAKKAEMTNPTDVRESIRQAYLEGRFSLDDYVVTERLRCADGFAILGEGKGTAFAVTVVASLTLHTGHELAKGELAPEYRTSGGSYESFMFDASDPNGNYPTPTFAAPMGIDRKQWARLLWMKRYGNVVVDASGKQWPVRKTPINLRHLPKEQRVYQPDAEGVMTPDEILEIPLDEFFETFESLDGVFFVDEEAHDEAEGEREEIALQTGAGAGAEPDDTA
jgi:DDE superfamily endonuclease